MTILLATNNSHKVREILQIIPDVTVRTPGDLGISFHHEETGTSFAENARGKAEALWRELQKLPTASRQHIDAVLADDSGICVDALEGRPGIYSARYGADNPVSPATTDSARNQLLLSEMEDCSTRSARYVCAVAALRGPHRELCISDTLEGEIAAAPSDGSGGFGYDPIFYLPELGCTAADITAEQKHAISHRGKAIRQAIAALRTSLQAAAVSTPTKGHNS